MPGSRPSRRAFLRRSAAGAAGLALAGPRGLAGSAGIVRSAAAVPSLPCGVSAGIAGADRAVIWSRCDRPSRMVVEYATTDRFSDVRRIVGPAALEGSDFTARTVLSGLPRGQHIFYRVRFEDLAELGNYSDPVLGVFRTPGAAGTADLTIAWSADTVGQGWGINPDWGGLRMYETLLGVEPDVFVNSGDTIYADQPVRPEVRLDDGTTWKNVVTEAKSKPCETVDDFRGAYQYNLLDAHMRRFNAAVGQIVQSDDHEVHDNCIPRATWAPTGGIA